ncbi:MAG: ribonuclease J [Clostridiales bacterium]|nr:ribonuclease J [Candidatus Apopatousia equi]
MNKVEAKQENNNQSCEKKSKNALKVMFLGGVGEIGKNMMALEYGRDIIIIDCGSTFPYGELMPGIDLVVPEISYLTQNKERIRGILVTHGHEDHIGAMPYVLDEIQVPVYGSKLTMALIENKLREFPKIKAKLNSVKPRDIVKLGCFSVEFITVNHSIAGAYAMAITCPAGVMVHTGDYKIDFTPSDGKITDLNRLAELGNEGVMLLTCESTNVEREGYSMSESTVGKTLDELFERFKDERLIIATFASNVYRLQQILTLAEKYGRKVTFTGRSMQNVTETAYKIGELKFDPKIFIDIDDVNKYPDNELLIISTGSQGEPMSALTRMASGEFPKIKLDEHDAVIFSSNPIPGNEKAVNIVINQLYRLGCQVIYNSLEAVHASGHAYKEEIKLVHSLLKPKFFIPVHGEYRHLKLHKDLAVGMGMEARNVVIAEVGQVVEVNSRSMKVNGTIPSGERLVDGLGLGDSDSSVLRDRKQLSEDGLAVAILGINNITREVSIGPDIISRGLIYSNEMESLIKEGKEVILKTVAEMPKEDMDYTALKNNIRKALGNFFFKRTKRRPVVLTILLEN